MGSLVSHSENERGDKFTKIEKAKTVTKGCSIFILDTYLISMKIGGCGGVGGGLLVMVVVMVCAFVNCEWVGCVVCDRGQSNLAN